MSMLSLALCFLFLLVTVKSQSSSYFSVSYQAIISTTDESNLETLASELPLVLAIEFYPDDATASLYFDVTYASDSPSSAEVIDQWRLTVDYDGPIEITLNELATVVDGEITATAAAVSEGGSNNSKALEPDTTLNIIGYFLLSFCFFGWAGFVFYWSKMEDRKLSLVIDVTISAVDIGTDTLYIFTEVFANPVLFGMATVSYTAPMFYALYVLLGCSPKLYGVDFFLKLQSNKETTVEVLGEKQKKKKNAVYLSKSKVDEENQQLEERKKTLSEKKSNAIASENFEEAKRLKEELAEADKKIEANNATKLLIEKLAKEKIEKCQDELETMKKEVAQFEADKKVAEFEKDEAIKAEDFDTAGKRKTDMDELDEKIESHQAKIVELTKMLKEGETNDDMEVEILPGQISEELKETVAVANSSAIVEVKPESGDADVEAGGSKRNSTTSTKGDKDGDESAATGKTAMMMNMLKSKVRAVQSDADEAERRAARDNSNFPPIRWYHALEQWMGSMNSLDKVLGMFFIMLIATTLYLAYAICAFVIIFAFNVCFWLLWALLGTFGIATKALILNEVRGKWLGWWTGKEIRPSRTPINRNTYHKSQLIELLVESAPQLFIQLVNNSINNPADKWTVLAYISVLGSAGMIVRAIYPYCYYLLYRRWTLKEMPLRGDNNGDEKMPPEEDENFGIERNWEMPDMSKAENKILGLIFLMVLCPFFLTFISLTTAWDGNGTGLPTAEHLPGIYFMLITSLLLFLLSFVIRMCAYTRGTKNGGDMDDQGSSAYLFLFSYIIASLINFATLFVGGDWDYVGPRWALFGAFVGLIAVLMFAVNTKKQGGEEEEQMKHFAIGFGGGWTALSIIMPMILLIIAYDVDWGPNKFKIDGDADTKNLEGPYALVTTAIVFYAFVWCFTLCGGFFVAENSDEEIILGTVFCGLIFTIVAASCSLGAARYDEAGFSIDYPGPRLAMAAGLLPLILPILMFASGFLAYVYDEYKIGRLHFWILMVIGVLTFMFTVISLAEDWFIIETTSGALRGKPLTFHCFTEDYAKFNETRWPNIDPQCTAYGTSWYYTGSTIDSTGVVPVVAGGACLQCMETGVIRETAGAYYCEYPHTSTYAPETPESKHCDDYANYHFGVMITSFYSEYDKKMINQSEVLMWWAFVFALIGAFFQFVHGVFNMIEAPKFIPADWDGDDTMVFMFISCCLTTSWTIVAALSLSAVEVQGYDLNMEGPKYAVVAGVSAIVNIIVLCCGGLFEAAVARKSTKGLLFK